MTESYKSSLTSLFSSLLSSGVLSVFYRALITTVYQRSTNTKTKKGTLIFFDVTQREQNKKPAEYVDQTASSCD